MGECAVAMATVFLFVDMLLILLRHNFIDYHSVPNRPGAPQGRRG